MSQKTKTIHILPEVNLNDTSVLERNIDNDFTLEEEAIDHIYSRNVGYKRKSKNRYITY